LAQQKRREREKSQNPNLVVHQLAFPFLHTLLHQSMFFLINYSLRQTSL
jgi:hypothetical protein